MTTPFGFLIPPAAPLVPPELEVQTISANQLAYTIPAAAINSSVAVFLLPGQSLPAGSAAALYVQFPGQDFKFLGALGEGKASAVFRVAGLKDGAQNGLSGNQAAGPEVDMDADETQSADAASGNVTIGISLEAADEVQAKIAEQRAQQQQSTGSASSALVRRAEATQQGNASKPSTKVLAQRIIQNAFNFLASFEGGSGMVPIKAFEAWWKKFEGRVSNDPGFLEREQD